MPSEDHPKTIRPLFKIEEEKPGPPVDAPEIINRPQEAKRVAKRITSIVDEHRHASLALGVTLGAAELRIVIAALRDHAKGGPGTLDLTNRDELQSHCLRRLFEELVEEPSNILYATKTGADSIRYDAMESSFWIECLDLLQKNKRPNQNS
jgi:hypothetical protein